MKALNTFTNFKRGVWSLIILLTGLTACQRKTPQATGTTQTSETADKFPVTIAHAFGETTIKSEPKRIISLSFGRADTLWALGVKPIAVRYSYGDYEYAAWPWIKKALGDNKPFVIKGELDFEKIAELEPDVILALYSGIKQEDYDILSKIAPVVARPKEYAMYGTPWEVQTLTVGKAIGKYKETKTAIDGVNAKLAKIAKDHPEWKGKSAVVAFVYKNMPGAYTKYNSRFQLLYQLGFVDAPGITANMKGKEDHLSFSKEDMSPMEADILLWTGSGDDLKNIQDLQTRKFMKTHKEGREIFLENLMTGAFVHNNFVSLNYAIDQLVPMIEKAIDGDPNTVVESTQKADLLD